MPDPIDDLLDALDVEELDRDLYRARNPFPGNRPALYGGQVLAQALRAAALTVPEGRMPHSLHGYFLRPGDTNHHTLLRVDRDRDGRSFSARRVAAIQHGEVIFDLAASFHVDEPGLELQTDATPGLPPPEGLPDGELGIADADNLALLQIRPIIAPSVEGESRVRRPAARMWIRTRGRMPDDGVLHACVLAYISDLGTGFGDTPLPGVHRSGGPSLDHALWIHHPPRVDEWMLVDLAPLAAAGARGMYHGGVFDRSGRRCASIAQEILLRRKL